MPDFFDLTVSFDFRGVRLLLARVLFFFNGMLFLLVGYSTMLISFCLSSLASSSSLVGFS